MASTKVTFVTGTAEVRRRDPSTSMRHQYAAGGQVEQPQQLLTTEPNTPSQVTYVDGKCTCCPYGYHIDLDFLNFCRDLESGSTLRNLKRIQRTKRKLRKSMEIMLDEQDGVTVPPNSAPPDVVHSTEAGRLMHMVNYERSATHRILSHIDHSVGSTIANIDGRGDHRFASTSDSDDTYSPISPNRRFPERPMDESTHLAPSFSTSGRTDSMSSLSSVSTVSSDAAMMYQAQLYQQHQQNYQHSLTQKTTTRVSDMPCPRASPDVNQMSLQSVREAMSVSLHRLRELEDQVKSIPILQVRISVLKEEKRLLNLQLKASQANNRLESPRQKVPPPTLPKPVRTFSVGVGDHSVIEPYNLQPNLPTGYTICENESHTEIYSSTKVTTTQINPPSLSIAPRPLTRSVGVGEGNVFDTSLHVHEKEFRTVLMGQGGVAKRNVGIECRVPTRDVGVLFQCDEEKPETRTVGVNVNYDTSDIVTSFDFRGETELRMALRGVLQRNVRSVATNCNFRPQTMDSSTYTNIQSGITVGTGDDQTMRTDVEIRPATVRKSVGTTAKPDTVNKNSGTERGWMLDASTNTVQADRMHRSVMTDKQRQAFAATNTESVSSRGSSNQTDVKMFLAMDQLKHASNNTEKPTMFSVPVNTEPVRTFSTGVNTLEKVTDLFKPEPEQKTVITEVESTKLLTERKPLMVDRGVGDGVVEEEEQYSFSETTEVITQPKVLTVEEKILKRGANQASAFLTCKSHEVSAVSDSTSSVSEAHIDDGNTHFTSFERSRSSTAPHTRERTERHSSSGSVSAKALESPSGSEECGFQETIVEHYIITKDGKRLISEEKTLKSAAGNNHSFKRYSDEQTAGKPTAWESELSDSKTGSYSSKSSINYNGSVDGQREIKNGDLISSTYHSGVENSFNSSPSQIRTEVDSHSLTSSQSSNYGSSVSSRAVITTVTETDKDGNTVIRAVEGSGSSSSKSLQSFGESDTRGPRSSSASGLGGISYSESVITSVGHGDSGEDFLEEHSYGSLDRRTGKLKSILKHSKSETDQLNEKRGITFAETVKGGTGSSSEEAANSSDSDDSTTSFEEGSYDSQQGQVIYRCKDDEAIAQGIPGAQMFDQNIRETYELTNEVRDACSVLATYLQDSTTIQTKELNASQAVVQQEWFQVSSLKLSSDHQVEDFLSSVNEISKRLLEYIVNMTDANGNTAIHYCVSHCNFHIASLLLDSELCDINQQNKAGYTPIMLAGLADVVNLGQLEVVRRIFSLGDVNARAATTQQTALMLAASHGRPNMVRMLVEAGADLNAQDVDGSTALMCACEHGHLDIVNFMLSQPSIDASIVDNENSSALTVAMEAGHKDVGVVLYKHLNFSKPHTAAGSHRKRKSSSSPTPSL
ncbi:hypothetical protein EGW08_010723 [Elysia chlorotica]|uniref:Uncharacterized protein n=1 Tax=Elysia chlorotica TaxID=188477 RepID=A0A3S1BE53_ELYCH|nr:hypothetical protein EGW08_010723 [Elysia chlorotica]